MFRRIMSWIFTPGTTEVSIDRSMKPRTQPWWSKPIDKVPEPAQNELENISQVVHDASSLDHQSQESMGSNHIEKSDARLSEVSAEQIEYPKTFSEVRERVSGEDLRNRNNQEQLHERKSSDHDVAAGLPDALPHPTESISHKDPVTSTVSLTGMERTALYQLMGSRYVAETKSISDSQLQIIRKFAGFDWLPSERVYWKGEYQEATEPVGANTESPVSKETLGDEGNGQSEFSTSANRNVQVGKHTETPTGRSVQTEEALNEEQQRVIDYIENTSSNLLITGRAGSGKSFLLRYLLKHSHARILPVAFMGIAALNIGGSTIHSAFKLPLQLLLPSTGGYIADRLSEEERSHYREYRMLVVDEVSMVAADQFVAMDTFLRSINENDEPFGGVQVVLFGDPYQLPPVVIRQAEAEFYSDNWGGPYFFNTNSWHEGAFSKVELQGSERQSDRSFLELLDAMRVGELSADQWSALQSRVVAEESLPNSGAVRIAPVNELADKYNEIRLRQLPGTVHLFHGEATGEYRKNWKRLPAPMKLYLKNGAQVIMVKNDPRRRWVNGSVGRVFDVSANGIIVEINGLNYDVDIAEWDKESHTYDRARKMLESSAYSRYRQYPVALGWARTIHKSQGQTFDTCIVDLRSKMFEVGQAYVACSRTRSLDSLYFTAPLTQSSVMTSDAVRNFMADLVTPTQLPPF